jgi:hypothetical protein
VYKALDRLWTEKSLKLLTVFSKINGTCFWSLTFKHCLKAVKLYVHVYSLDSLTLLRNYMIMKLALLRTEYGCDTLHCYETTWLRHSALLWNYVVATLCIAIKLHVFVTLCIAVKLRSCDTLHCNETTWLRHSAFLWNYVVASLIISMKLCGCDTLHCYEKLRDCGTLHCQEHESL